MFDVLKRIIAAMPEAQAARGELPEPPACAGIGCQNSVTKPGDFCPICQRDLARGYQVLSLAGRCANGLERDHGSLWHAVPLGEQRAMCKERPGRRSAGWSSWTPENQPVTCPRCLKKIAAQNAPYEGRERDGC